MVSAAVAQEKKATKEETEQHEQLVKAIRLGHLEEVKRLVKAGVPLTPMSRSDMTALGEALDARQKEVALYLLSWKPGFHDYYYHDHEFVKAVFTGDVELAKAVAEMGFAVDGDAKDRHRGRSIMDGAVKTALLWDHVNMLNYFREEGYNFDEFYDSWGQRSLLTFAARYNAYGAMAWLLLAGEDPNKHDSPGFTPLAVATGEGATECVELLLEAGADPNVPMKFDPGETNRIFYSYPLFSAVWCQRADLVEMLLKAGARADIMDNAPIKLADMLGSRVIYDMLLAAGAPKPGRYEFRELARTIDPRLSIRHRSTAPKRDTNWNLVNFLNQSALESGEDAPPPALEEEIKVAVVTSGEGLEDLETLLAAKLSAQPKLRLLERENMAELVQERQLQELDGDGQSSFRKLGKLLGADALIILSRSNLTDKDQVCSARIVHAGSGVVAESIVWKQGERPAEEMAEKIGRQFLKEGANLSLNPEEIVLLSIPRLSTGVSNARSRLLQRQLPLAMSQIMSREPGVFMVERQMMEALRLEKDLNGDERPFSGSAWLTDGTVEVSLNPAQRDVSVKLTLTAGDGRSESVAVKGSQDDMPGLLRQLRDGVMKVVGRKGDADWDPEKEAQAYYRRSKWFEKMSLEAEAESALQAAWALGLQTPEMEEALLRVTLKRLHQAWAFHKQLKIDQLDGFDQYMGYRAAHLFPRLNIYEMTAEEYLERSNRLLDLYEPYLQNAPLTDSSRENPLWYIGNVMAGASKSLEILHSLSAEEEYGAELDALRERLLAMTRGTLKRIDAAWPASSSAYNVVMINYLRWLSFWVTDEEAFVAEIEEILNQIATPKYRRNRNAIMQAMFEIGKERVNTNSGRSNMAWMRLAHRLQKSDQPMARLWAHAILLRDDNRPSRQRKHLLAGLELAEDYILNDDGYPALTARISDLDDHNRLFDNRIQQVAYDWPRLAVMENLSLHDGVHGLVSHDLPEMEAIYNRWVLGSLKHIAKTKSGTFLYPRHYHMDELGEKLPEYIRGFQAVAKVYPDALKHDPELVEIVGSRFDYITRAIDRLNKEKEETKATAKLVLKGFRPYSDLKTLAPHNSKYRSRHERDIDAVWYGQGIPWLYFERVGFMRIEDGGKMEDFVPLPERKWQSMSVPRLSKSGIVLAYHYDNEDDIRCSGLAVYDLAKREWEFVDLGPEFRNIFSFFLSDQYVGFSFESDPSDERDRKLEDRATESLDESTRGVLLMDRKTGAQQLLVSSRRTPPESPLDGQDQWRYSVVPVDEASFIVPKRHLYDISKKEWRKPTKEERTQAQRSNNGPPYIYVRGRAWRIQAKFGDNPKYIFSTTMDANGKRAKRLQVEGPIEVDFSLPTGFRQRFPDYPENVDPMKEGVKIRRLPGAHLCYNDYGFFYLTDDQLRPVIEQAIEEQGVMKEADAEL